MPRWEEWTTTWRTFRSGHLPACLCLVCTLLVCLHLVCTLAVCTSALVTPTTPAETWCLVPLWWCHCLLASYPLLWELCTQHVSYVLCMLHVGNVQFALWLKLGTTLGLLRHLGERRTSLVQTRARVTIAQPHHSTSMFLIRAIPDITVECVTKTWGRMSV